MVREVTALAGRLGVDTPAGARHVRRAAGVAARLTAVFAITLVAGVTVTVTPADAQRSLLGLEEPGPDEPLNLNADQLTYEQSGRTAVASGNVEIQYGNYTVFADRVTYNRDTGKLTASGNVRLIEPGGNVVEARYIELADKFREGFVRQLRLLLTNEARLTARSAERSDGNINILNEASYTACKACKDHPDRPLVWRIKARRVIQNQEKREITYEDASFEFFGVPLLYIPKFSHPDPTVRRKSGFLVPTFSVSDEFGFGVETPYFFNLAPNYDFTASPVFTTEQGVLAQGQWRHRVANGAYSITPTGIYQLDPGEPPGDERFRGSIATQGEFALSRYWNAGWDAIFTSDDTYLRRYKIDNRTDLVSNVHLTGLAGENYFDARAYRFRGLLATDVGATTPYVAPVVDHEYSFYENVLGGSFDLDSNILNLQRDVGPDSTRAISNLQWERQFIGSPGFIVTPFAQLRGDVYYVDNVPNPAAPGGTNGEDTVARVLPATGVDVRMPFVSRGPYSNHIFEPVAQIIARPNETNIGDIPNEDSMSFEFDDINLFSINKFTGLDRWEGGTRANIGFNYTVNLDNGASARLTAGESIHLAGRNSFGPGTGLNTDRSDFVGSLYLQFNQNFSASARVRLDEDTLDIRRNEIGARADFERFTATVNYADIDAIPAFGLPTREEEIVANASFRFSRYWRAFGGIRYDIARSRTTTDAVGVGYEDECFAVNVAYRETFTEDRDVDPEQAVMLRFTLKTIGSGGFSAGID